MKRAKRPYRVVFYTSGMSGGGAERVVLNLLKRVDRSQYQTYLALGQKRGPYLSRIPDDVPVIDLKGDVTSNAWYYIRQLSTVLSQTEADLIVSFLVEANITSLMAKLLGHYKRKFIVSVRNNLTVKLGQMAGIKKWRNEMFVRWVYPRADRIISLSGGVKQDLVRSFGIPPALVTPIYNPIEVDEIQALAQTKSNDLVFGEQHKIIVSVGRLAKQKGYSDLIKAFASVRRRMPAKLIILGEGPRRSELEVTAEQLDLVDDVYMPGFVSNPWGYVARADVFILPSLWEGFGNVIVEAMACGTPVIATSCDYGPSEIIRHGENGILVPVGDIHRMSEEIVRLLTDSAEATRLSTNGYQRARDFDSTKICKLYEEVFEAVLRGGAN